MIKDSTIDLKDLLMESIRLIKQARPRLSTNALAASLSIPSSTLSRIENSGTAKPEFKHAIAILKAAHGEKLAHTFAKRYYPQLVVGLEQIYKANKDTPFAAVDSEKYFQDPTTYELMLMATSGTGIHRKVVESEYGNKGLTILDELLANEVLIETDGVIAIKTNINARQETVHKLTQNLIARNYDLAAFGRKDNWLSLQYEAVNLEKVMPVLHEIMERANSEIRAILNDPAYKGKDIVWASMTANSLKKQGSEKKVFQ
ncbi:MAG: hypothetical protein ACLGG0_11025 [Bacteriovoracia bacterium]